MPRIQQIGNEEALVTGGPVATEESIAYLITDFQGLDIMIKFGLTAQGERVMKQWMRVHGTEQWFSTVEMLLEAGNYFGDTNSGLIPGGGKEIPPTPS